MSILGKVLKDAGNVLTKGVEDTLDEIERSPKNVKKIFRTIDPTQLWRSPRGPRGPRPIVPAEYAGDVSDEQTDMLDDLEDGDISSCQRAGTKSWTIPSTIVIPAAALPADTDLGGTTNPFANANSAFFTTAGVFPQPFLCYGIGGMISATQPAAATEVPALLDGLYMSMRATTELSRQSLTRDLGMGITLNGNVAAAAGTGAAMIKPSGYRPWRQLFSPRTTYVWGARIPRATTTVGTITYTLLLHGLLMEGGAGRRR